MEAKRVLEKQYDTYIQKPMISKNIFAIRAKGVWLEDILEYLKKELELELESYYYGDDTGIGYYEHYYNSSKRIKVMFSHARLGLPDLVVGTNTKKEWIELREMLRKNGFVR